MTWIKSVPPAQAGPALAGTYEKTASFSKWGRVSNLWQALGGDPPGLETLHAHYRSLMGDPAPLTRAQAEMIALVVSATNGSEYCVAHHGPRLAALAGEPLARAVALDYREANLAARDRVLLDAAVALTCEPAERTNADVERLREYGFDDGSILKLTEIAALYNLVNRVASALGVPLEDGMARWEFGAQR
ncbi:MAG TPA: peroxidase-related enzyme [Methylomirabilota bacterium]|nr:peroxidase-related enzyme [Methylomirabilota bacterium]